MSLSEQTPPPFQPESPTAPPPEAPRPTSGLAITGLILAFLIFPIGFVLSLIAVFTTGKAPKPKGRGLAIAGLIVSTIAIAVTATIVIFVSSSSALSDQGCIDGKAAILASDNIATTGPQPTIDALRAAAGKSDNDDVKAAMNNLANTYDEYFKAAQTGEIPPALDAKLDADAARIDELCTLGG